MKFGFKFVFLIGCLSVVMACTVSPPKKDAADPQERVIFHHMGRADR